MRRRARPVFCLAFLIIYFCLFAHPSKAAASTTITGEITVSTTWTKENNPYIVLGQVKVKAPLTIEAGTIVKFSTGSNDGLNIQSDFFVKGTADEKVVFTSRFDDLHGGDTDGDHGYWNPHAGDWISLNFNPYYDKILDIENAQILYSAFGVSIFSSTNYSKNRTVKNCELKNNGYGIVVYNAEPVIENNVISNNQFGVAVNASSRIAKITNNSIFDNETGAVGKNPTNPSLGALDAKNNWWGDRSGPSRADNPDGKGDLANGLVSFDPWLKQDPAHIGDPVIIIPGIMGSWEVNGKWKIDPILHSYENLKKELSENGYTSGVNMFDFPYQWRNSNIDNAKLLKDVINVVKEKTGRPKVDLIAHSMGGLLAREYIESDYYQDDVDQLITLGTPHNGAPKAYLMWEAGKSGTLLDDFILENIFNREAKKAGYNNLFSYVRDKIISAQELLPVYNYIFDLDKNSPRIYPEKYPKNNFLENLNSADRINKLKKVEFDNIYGKADSSLTLGGYKVINAPAFGDYWKDGYPKDYDILWSSDGLVYVNGDTTVPLSSASYPDSDYKLEVNATHNMIPTEAQQDVVELLTGKRPANKITGGGLDIKELLMVQVYCPIDVQVISPSGKIIGTDFSGGSNINEIDGATYIKNGDDEEFLTIPNPEDGEYQVLTEGTGTGEYKVDVTKISENSEGAEESTQTISGTAAPEQQDEATVKVEGTKVMKLAVAEPSKSNAGNETPAADNTEKTTEIKSDNSIEPGLEEGDNHPLTKTEQLNAIRNNVLEYFNSGQIKKKSERNYILKRLGDIRADLTKYEISENNPKKFQKSGKKSRLAANQHVDKLAKHIRQNSPKRIDADALLSLIDDLNSLKIN